MADDDKPRVTVAQVSAEVEQLRAAVNELRQQVAGLIHAMSRLDRRYRPERQEN